MQDTATAPPTASAPTADDARFWAKAASYRRLARFPLTRGLAKRGLTRLCRARGDRPMLIAHDLAGQRVMLDLRTGADRGIFLDGRGDPRGISAIEKVMRRLDCRMAWDVGANRGNHSAFMRRNCRHLVAFEPNPVEHKRTSDIFRGQAGVDVLNIGLSSTNGTLPFHIDEENSGISSFEIKDRPANVFAPVRTGDSVALEQGWTEIDFMKIDVENHEVPVLEGMQTLIASQRPVIVMEILESGGISMRTLTSLLPGYSLYGNRTGFLSKITKSAYSFCPFEEGKTYMVGLFVPTEKLSRLKDILPEG